MQLITSSRVLFVMSQMDQQQQSHQKLLSQNTDSPAVVTEETLKTLMSPKQLRIMVCASDGRVFMSQGIPQHMYDIRQPAYDSLCIEPLVVPDDKQAPPCYCEYIVLREGCPDSACAKPPNAICNRIAGTFYILKFVTSKPTLNRIQIEVAQYNQPTILQSLHKKYK